MTIDGWYYSEPRRRFSRLIWSLPLWWRLWCVVCSPREWWSAVTFGRKAVKAKRRGDRVGFETYIWLSDRSWGRVLDIDIEQRLP